MEKFFNFSFKIGGFMSSVFILVVSFVMLFSAINFAINLKPVQMQVPTFEQLSLDATIISGNETTSKEKNVKKYLLSINEIVKVNNLNNYGKAILINSLDNIDEDQKELYVNGLKPFITEYSQLQKAKKRNVTEHDLMNTVQIYQNQFKFNLQVKELKATEQKINLITTGLIFLSSILLFIMCLIVPLLIRIEENTRK